MTYSILRGALSVTESGLSDLSWIGEQLRGHATPLSSLYLSVTLIKLPGVKALSCAPPDSADSVEDAAVALHVLRASSVWRTPETFQQKYLQICAQFSLASVKKNAKVNAKSCKKSPTLRLQEYGVPEVLRVDFESETWDSFV